ncbi:MAG: hypothetical protein D6681_07510 [Calditrichaeota bacterium]|nr:MAG: hypothetical protein D6681_07510 [Calditrichota bacterium]
MQRKYLYIGAGILVALVAILWFVLRKDLSNHIVIPYIAHQPPRVDPHLSDAVALSDKLDEVLFDGLFNVVATPSGVAYEDALGELIDIDEDNVVTVRLNLQKKWHSSYRVTADDDEVNVSEAEPQYFTAEDLRFTLRRIQRLGSLSLDYILVSQAIESFDFEGPDRNNEIRFQFKGDRDWTEADIKEVLSFKIIPHTADLQALNIYDGSGPYLAVPGESVVDHFYRNPAGSAHIDHVVLKPFIDNSTFTTELKNGNINVLLEPPFGSLSPILEDPEDFFYKSNISTSFFCILLNTRRLNREQRQAVRDLINNRVILERFYKVGTPQQRHITDYKGNYDNYQDYLNYSVFPTSSYYVDEEVVVPPRTRGTPNPAVLPDSLRIVACVNYGHREEYEELIEILNDKSLTGGRIHAVAVQNEALKEGNYDGVLLAIDGYKSNFLFDLYTIFMREPDLSLHKINLVTETNAMGETVASPLTWDGNNNFCRLNALREGPEREDIQEFLEYVYGFMYSNHIGDKQHYAQLVDEKERELALGVWLFSMPSLAYFSTQFDERTIVLYGVASQLSTIEQWQERRED